MFHPQPSYDPSGDCAAIEKYRQTVDETSQIIDSPLDQITDSIVQRANGYSGPIPTTVRGFAQAMASIARAAITAQAISGMVFRLVEEQLRTIRIQTVTAMLSIIKDAKPHLNIDVIEHVFQLANLKESDIAKKNHESRQVVNKRVKAMQRHFGIETEAQVEVATTYRESRLNQYQAARKKLQCLNLCNYHSCRA
jgi:hypothetical protein